MHPNKFHRRGGSFTFEQMEKDVADRKAAEDAKKKAAEDAAKKAAAKPADPAKPGDTPNPDAAVAQPTASQAQAAKSAN